MRRTLQCLLAGMAALGLALAQLPAPTSARTAAMPSDFNGDGYADLAIGVTGEQVGSARDAGAVNVLYGSRRGVTAVGDDLWTQASPGVKGKAEGCSRRDCEDLGDEFGFDVASGDFDRDGRADLAIGVPRDRAGGVPDAGAVNVLYGSRRGLTARGDQRWSRANLPGVPSAGDGFGGALAAGDFDGDGYWDLAIGETGQEGRQGVSRPGRVQVLYGGPDGLGSAGTATLARSMTGTGDVAYQGFGVALAAGDLDGDGRADLAVGAPDNSCMSSDCVTTGGDVSVFYGTADGLGAIRAERWSQDSPGILDEAETDDHLGAALAIGDFDADGFDDLAAGAFYEWLGPCVFPYDPCHAGQGAVSVIYGSTDGLTAEGNQLWHQGVAGVPGTPEFLDLCGDALAAGDFNGDGADELAIGVPGEDFGSKEGAGAVLVLPGSRGSGLTATGAQSWTQASPGVPGTREIGDVFGLAVASADYGRSARDDLVIAAPGEDRVIVLYGRTSGLSSVHAQSWSQRTPGVKGVSRVGDMFGLSLTP